MTRETRSLPALAPGSADTTFVIMGYDEVVAHDTVWCDHSHPFHELLWNERGASTAVVDARVWTVTPTLGLWMPAGTMHSGSAVAGTWFRAAFFGFHTTSSISDTPVAVEITPLLRHLERGTTIVMVLHDLNLAARYADHLIALANGRLHAMGSPAEVLTQENVHAVFGLDSRVIEDPVSGRPLMLPIGRHHVRPRADARTADVE